jgi:homoserine O-succinyltransferase/O-acetyltransferase
VTNVEQFAFYHAGPRRRSSDVIHIGLVNNMPDAAMRLTELQFARLLRDAAGPIDVRLSLFSFPEIARGEQARSRMEGTYADTSTLPTAHVDALIVTGAEPREADLRDEAFWPSLTRLTDWAEAGTISAIFSCLAAHAAVLHLDGIARRALPRKLIGVFDCAPVADDALMRDMPAPMQVPHARLNELPEDALAARGYQILSRMADGGVNVFQRKTRSLFVFLQGHPEYDGDSLAREYCRDVGRFLRGENATCTPVPEHYFSPAAEDALQSLAAAGRDPASLARYSEIIDGAMPGQFWRPHTIKFLNNWLASVAAEKMRRRAKAVGDAALRRNPIVSRQAATR